MADTDIAVIPGTGQVIDLNDTTEVAQAMLLVRDLERQLREARALFTEALVARSLIEGSKTLHTESGKVVVKGGEEVVWDAYGLRADLRAAGMPEERVRDIVTETVELKVVASEAKRAAGANPKYREAVERNRATRPKTPYVTVTPPGGNA